MGSELIERREHDLRTWPKPFAAVRSGLKPWELRKNDRDFKVGDLLRLREWAADTGYSGEVEERVIAWILDGGQYGLPEGFCIMTLASSLALPPPAGDVEADRGGLNAANPINETQMAMKLRRAAARTTWEQGDGASSFEVKHPDRALLEEAASMILALVSKAPTPSVEPIGKREER